jgi:hypothetical protein
MSDQFKASLRDLPAAKPRHEQSPARARIREAYTDITAARARGVSWQQIADLMTREGITGTDGKPITAAKVNSLYAAEKATRGERRKPRAKKTTARAPVGASPPIQPAATPQQPGDAVPFDPGDGAPDDKPKPKFSVSSRPK